MYVTMHELALFDISWKLVLLLYKVDDYIQIAPYVSPMDQDRLYFAYSVDKNGNEH